MKRGEERKSKKSSLAAKVTRRTKEARLRTINNFFTLMNLGAIEMESVRVPEKTVEFLSLLLFLFDDASCLKNIFSPDFTRRRRGKLLHFSAF